MGQKVAIFSHFGDLCTPHNGILSHCAGYGRIGGNQAERRQIIDDKYLITPYLTTTGAYFIVHRAQKENHIGTRITGFCFRDAQSLCALCTKTPQYSGFWYFEYRVQLWIPHKTLVLRVFSFPISH